MKIKKYVAKTEQEAMEAAKAELGKDAMVISIKKSQPKGLFAIFRRPSVEVTAAYEEKSEKVQQPLSMPQQLSAAKELHDRQGDFAAVAEKVIGERKELERESRETMDKDDPREQIDKDDFSELKDNIMLDQQEKINQLQQEIDSKEKILSQVLDQMSGLEQAAIKKSDDDRYSNSMMQLMYDVLTDQGVDSQIAQNILEELDLVEENDKLDINFIVKIVYNNIVNILSGGKGVEVQPDSTATVCFFGPTGVGKTTTIAKLSSKLILDYKSKVGLITADTYRIAAVQQLRTYADILGIDIGICYNNIDLMDQLAISNTKNDIVLIDTAGCSIKNKEMIEELGELLLQIPDAQKFLVLSLTTKWEDLVKIINRFGKITSFDLVLTKMDETTSYGAILNLCYMTKQKIAYVTNGQNVPNDIEVMSPEKIAKALLEFGGDEL